MGTESITRNEKKVEALRYPTLTSPIWEATDAKPVKPVAAYDSRK